MDSVNKSLRPTARPRSKTGEETKYGRPVWKDEATGDLFSEKTVTVPYGDGFVVMPSVTEDGSELTEEQISKYVIRNGPVDFMTGEKLPIFESMEEADTYAQKRSETMFTDEDPTPRIDDSMSDMDSEEDGTSLTDVGKSILKLGIAGAQLAGKKLGMDTYPTEDNPYGFAEGGLTVDSQMRMFMAEGGLKDDGMMRDPVSGNEIPPGSMAEEVRDDIPAQLSEGEYVVPADVVKYFGVKFFEELRAEAKSGLSTMEQNGRIGGEPVPAGGPRQDMMGVTGGLTQEELAELEGILTDSTMMNMAQGGIVPQQYGMPMAQPQVDPYSQQATMYGSGMSKGYDKGGLESEMESIQSYQTFDPANYQLGFSFAQPGGVATQTAVMLYGPNGEVVSLMMPRDTNRFNQLLSQGYTTEQQSVKPGEEVDEEDPAENYGGLADGQQGKDNQSDTDSIDFADTFLGDLLGLDGKLGVQGPGLLASLKGARRGKDKSKSTDTGKDTKGTDTTSSTTDTTPSTPSAGGVPSDTADEGTLGDISAIGDGGTTAGPTAGGVAADTADEGTAADIGAIGDGGTPSGPTADGVAADTADDGTSADIGAATGASEAAPDSTDATGPFNKGGLATKRTKAKRKPTNMNKGGLASPRTKK